MKKSRLIMNYSHVLHSELNYKNLLQNLNVKKCVNLDRYFRNNTYSICAVLSDTKIDSSYPSLGLTS